jgi:hypothetical protein
MNKSGGVAKNTIIMNTILIILRDKIYHVPQQPSDGDEKLFYGENY